MTLLTVRFNLVNDMALCPCDICHSSSYNQPSDYKLSCLFSGPNIPLKGVYISQLHPAKLLLFSSPRRFQHTNPKTPNSLKMKMTLRKAFLRLMLVGGARGLLQPTAKTLEPRFFKDAQSQRLAITYGNFSVPGMGDHHGMKTFSTTIPPPCSDCFVTHAQADLQYANGTYANVNTGMWLHHVVVFNLNRSGIVCPTIPDIAFACGNERTPANICVNGYVDHL